MDLKYKDKDVEISIKNINKNSILTNEELNSVVQIIELLKNFNGNIKSDLGNIIKETVSIETPKQKQNVQKIDKPVIRDRLPNQVDLSEFELKQAVTEKPLLRCPCCGQTANIIVNISDVENYFMHKILNDKNNEEYRIITQLELDDIDGMLKQENVSITDYNADISNIKINSKFKDKDVNANNDTNILCPVCHVQRKLKDWIEAYKHPLDFGFETENMCDVCGHESTRIVTSEGQAVMKCEYCGNTKNIVE